jgi:hypothetical protein
MWPHKLFVKNPDGSGTAAFYGSNSWWPVSMLHVRAVPGSNLVICTLAGHHSGSEQTGEIGLLDRSRGTEDVNGVVALFPPRKIEPIYRDDPRPDPNTRYTEPYPLSQRWFIVSGQPAGAKRFGLYLADFSGNRLLLHEDEKLDCLSAMPLSARPRPPVIPPQTDYRRHDATILLLDVYRGAGMAGVPRGSVKALGNEFTASGRAVIGNSKPLWNALGNDCRSCHPRGFSVEPTAAPCQVLDLPKTLKRPPVNLTHPEESRILTAPLARAAGGLELCGKPVWPNRDASGYRAALRVIRSWHDDLAARPREDMPGFVPCPAYTATQNKRRSWLEIEEVNRRNSAGL